ncbi:Hypothetical predicted protein [Mytilus galloprovincialis]|uniref:B box-type domain-containing protein n=1 Tax=Mytilus galloprovincialis TaxID=29158 RepID=A0A8B6F975_MYTGA|nr:Hypothetical predicted protein [Mytilus galloprovincialis]
MESLRTDLCTLCTDDGISNNAVTWCTECEGFLCTDCEKHHKRSKASKEHSTMSTVNYHTLPKSIRETSNRCKDHDKKYELYCSSHATPCCIQCIADTHQKCQDMKPLADILREVKSSAAIPLLKNDLKDLKESFEEVIKHIGDRIKAMSSQKGKGIEEIRSMRKLLDEHFDKLEREILGDINDKHSKIKSKLAELVKEMENRAKLVGQLEDEFSTMTKYATELQIYVGMQELEKAASKEAKFLEDLESGRKLHDKNIEIKILSEVYSVLQDVYSFGKISIKSTPYMVPGKIGRKDQAQLLVPHVPTVPKTEPIQPSLMKNLEFLKVMNNDPDSIPQIRQMRFFLDKETAHKDVSVLEKGTAFANNAQDVPLKSFNSNRHTRFKGARGTHVFTQPGIYFYEVILDLKIATPLQENNIAFEIGIARKSSIDEKKYIEGQPYSYSIVGAHHPACEAVCVHVVADKKSLLHKTLVKNKVDEECRIVLGFLLNTDIGTWEIYNIEDGENLCIVHNVNCEQPLFPVVSGYNPLQIQIA